MIDTEQKYIQKLSIQSLYWCLKDVLCRTRINVLWCFVDVFSTFTIDVQMKFLHYNFRRPQLQTTEDVWREPGVVQIKGLLHAAKATGRIWTSIVLCRWHYLCRKMILQLLILFFKIRLTLWKPGFMFFCRCFTLSLYPWCVIHHAGCQILRGSLCKWNAKIMTCWYDRFFWSKLKDSVVLQWAKSVLILQLLGSEWGTWGSMRKPPSVCGFPGSPSTPEMSDIIDWTTSAPRETEQRRR